MNFFRKSQFKGHFNCKEKKHGFHFEKSIVSLQYWEWSSGNFGFPKKRIMYIFSCKHTSLKFISGGYNFSFWNFFDHPKSKCIKLLKYEVYKNLDTYLEYPRSHILENNLYILSFLINKISRILFSIMKRYNWLFEEKAMFFSLYNWKVP